MKKQVILYSFILFHVIVLSQNQPNILVFIADDAGMDYGCYGNTVIQTPNIDSMAARGLLCKNAFLTAPQCSPSRTSMLSGQFAHTIGTEDLHTGLDDQTRILPSYLSEAGYYTGIMLKGHIGEHGMKQFDWYDEGFWPDYVKGKWFAKALHNFQTFLDNAGDKPFFLWMGFVDPHRPYLEDKVEANRATEVHDHANIQVPPYLADTEPTKKDLAHYYDEIARMDRQIGEFIGEIEKRNLTENTLIIFLSDNGYPFPRGKGTLYDAGIQTPLIFNWPGKISENTKYNGLISTIDLSPTLLDVAGIEKPAQMVGSSIQPMFYDQSFPGRTYVYAERNWHGTDEYMRCIRTKSHKLILNEYFHLPHGTPGDLSSSPAWYELRRLLHTNQLSEAQKRLFECPRSRVEIYNLQNDPYELINLADHPDYAESGHKLAVELEKWRKETNDHPSYLRKKPDIDDRVSGFRYPKSKLENVYETNSK